MLIGLGEDIIEDIRRHCAEYWHGKGCIVCGRGKDRLCWEHKKIIECYNSGRDINHRWGEEDEKDKRTIFGNDIVSVEQIQFNY